jgi:hypothetical protein
MSVRSLLNELEEEAQIEREKQCKKRLEAYVHCKPKPKSRAEVKRSKLFELRRRNNELRCELDLNRQLELEAKRHEEVALLLYLDNITQPQKRQQEEDTARMATWASGICKEAALTWREDAQAAFNAKKL